MGLFLSKVRIVVTPSFSTEPDWFMQRLHPCIHTRRWREDGHLFSRLYWSSLDVYFLRPPGLDVANNCLLDHWSNVERPSKTCSLFWVLQVPSICRRCWCLASGRCQATVCLFHRLGTNIYKGFCSYMNLFLSTWILLAVGLVCALPMIYLRVKEHTDIADETLYEMFILVRTRY